MSEIQPPLTVLRKTEGVTATVTVHGEDERHTGTLVTLTDGSDSFTQFVWEDSRGVAGYLVAPASDIRIESEAG